MLVKILFWGAIVWFAFEILRRLAISIFLIFGGYKENGLVGAFGKALIAFLVNLWDFFKTVFWIILFIFIFSLFLRGCSKEDTKDKNEIVLRIIPGESIAEVKLGMTDEQVREKLGDPSVSSAGDELTKMGVISDVSPDGKVIRSVEADKAVSVFLYNDPPLVVIFHNKIVRGLDLSYYENISVIGYPFVAFKYLTKDELDLLGKPSSTYRIKDSENKMMANAPKGTILEYYVYMYETLGMSLGLVFDRTKQQNSEYYIGVNRIDIISRQHINHNR